MSNVLWRVSKNWSTILNRFLDGAYNIFTRYISSLVSFYSTLCKGCYTCSCSLMNFFSAWWPWILRSFLVCLFLFLFGIEELWNSLTLLWARQPYWGSYLSIISSTLSPIILRLGKLLLFHLWSLLFDWTLGWFLCLRITASLYVFLSQKVVYHSMRENSLAWFTSWWWGRIPSYPTIYLMLLASELFFYSLSFAQIASFSCS